MALHSITSSAKASRLVQGTRTSDFVTFCAQDVVVTADSTRRHRTPDHVYRIKTVKPGAYPAGPDWTRPPHIHFEVHGQFERLITQMYFPDEPLNASDRLLNAALRPDLLVATWLAPSADSRVLNFDIILTRG